MGKSNYLKSSLLILISVFLVGNNIVAQSAKSDSLFAIGVDLYNARKYQEAIPVFEACNKLDKAELDSTSIRRNYSAMWLASCYYHTGDSVIAKTIDDYYCFTPVDRRLTEKSDSLLDIVYFYLAENETEKALECYEKCLEIIGTVVGNHHYMYGFVALSYCHLLLDTRIYDEALKYLRQVAEIIKRNYGLSPKYANVLIEESTTYFQMENFREAKKYAEASYDVWMKIQDREKYKDYINPFLLLSEICYEQGSYSESLKNRLEMRRLYEQLNGKDDSFYYAAILYKLVNCYDLIGDYAHAVELQEEIVQLHERVSGKISKEYCAQTNQLALFNYHLCNYSEGIRLGLLALKISEQVNGVNSTNHAAVISNLAMNYAGIGDYSRAIDLGIKALQINRDLKDEEGCANLLISIIGYYVMSKNYSDAIKYETEALNVCGEVYGKDNYLYSYLLNNLSLVHFGLRNFNEAVYYAKESLQISERTQGKKHPDYATSLYNLSSMCFEAGNNDEAIRHGKEAVNIMERTLGRTNPRYSSYSSKLASYYYEAKDVQKYSHYILESSKSRNAYILSQFIGLTSYEKKNLWNNGNETFYTRDIHMAAYTNTADSMVTNAYDGALLGKGILLNSEIEMKKMLMESKDEKVMRLYNEIQTNKHFLEQQYLKPISGRTINTDSVERYIDNLDRQLLGMSQIYGDYTKNMRIGWQGVQAKLEQKDVSIEFVSFPLNNDSTIYVAYVLKKGMTSPKMIPLFEEKQLKKGEGIYKNISVSKLVWEPLAEHLNGVQNVYFAPSGELYNIGIEYLPHWSGEGIMSEKWNMYRLSSTRQLAVIKDKNVLKQASVYGGVKYDTKEEFLVADSRKYRSQQRSFNYESFAVADSLNLRAGASYLPATKTEAQEIDKTLEQKKITTKLLIDTLATERAFKDLSGKKTNLLHIATHGFYWTEKEARYKDNLNFLILNDNHPKYVEDKALTRSGLLLAGANNALMGKKLPEGVDDGILTAKEISQLDLRGLDLVALSACETGLGEIKGDGVFGLQRGFKNAGANSLLMSLWKVDDEATRLLMTQFYKNLTSGMSKFESLRQAQKYVREYEVEMEVNSDIRPSISAYDKEKAQQNANKEKKIKKVKKYEAPKYWAAFILLDAID